MCILETILLICFNIIAGVFVAKLSLKLITDICASGRLPEPPPFLSQILTGGLLTGRQSEASFILGGLPASLTLSTVLYCQGHSNWAFAVALLAGLLPALGFVAFLYLSRWWTNWYTCLLLLCEQADRFYERVKFALYDKR